VVVVVVKAVVAATVVVVVAKAQAAALVKTAAPLAETTIDRTCLSDLLKQKGLDISSPFFMGVALEPTRL
jgi:hypothetical protein